MISLQMPKSQSPEPAIRKSTRLQQTRHSEKQIRPKSPNVQFTSHRLMETTVTKQCKEQKKTKLSTKPGWRPGGTQIKKYDPDDSSNLRKLGSFARPNGLTRNRT